MLDITDICQICLRTGRKLGNANKRLSEFHDELCKYTRDVSNPKYCMECEHLLRKVYKFKMKCSMAVNILKTMKETLFTKDLLYTLLPPSSLGFWHSKDSRDYQYVYEEQPPLPSQTRSVQTNKSILERILADELPATHIFHKDYENEILIQNIADSNYFNENLNDPLMNEDDIKIEDNLDNTIEEGIKTENNSNYTEEYTVTHSGSDDLEEYIKTNEKSVDLKEHMKTDNQSVDLEYTITPSDSDDLEERIETHNVMDIGGNRTGSEMVVELIKNINVIPKYSFNGKDSHINLKGDINKRKSSNIINKIEAKRNKSVFELNKKSCINIEHNYSLVEKNNVSMNSLMEFGTITKEDFDYSKNKNEINHQNEIRVNQQSGIHHPSLINHQNEIKHIKMKKDILQEKKALNIDIVKTLPNVRIDFDTITKNCDEMCNYNKIKYSKERLKAELLIKFAAVDELTTEDGTLIDKECILDIIDTRPDDERLQKLWSIVQGEDNLSARALVKLKDIQIRYSKKYEEIFEIEHLTTKEEILEEFRKRKTYDSYVNAKYKCEICYRGFEYEKMLNYHMRDHDVKAGDFVCPVCKTRRRYKKTCDSHINIHSTIYKCKLCPLVTNYRSSMLNHFHQHQGLVFKCQTCDVEFKSKSAYNTHLANYCKKQGLVCTLCARLALNATGLRIHITRKHWNDPPVDESECETCLLCNLKFPSQAVLARHIRISHKRDYQQLEETYIKNNRTLPPKWRSPQQSKTVKCHVCHATGKSYTWLNSHMRSEHPNVPDNKQFLCDFCGKRFMHECLLRNHLDIHNGVRTYQCDLCAKSFRTTHHLAEHRQFHFPPTRECNHCGKKFRSKANLYTHTRMHIGIRRFKCHICGKAFLHRSSLTEHIRGVHEHVRRVNKRKAVKTNTEE